MIKKLRIKFVCVIMVIVTVMLSIILGVVINYTSADMERQSIAMMRRIAEMPFQLGKLRGAPNDYRLPYLIVQVSPNGKVMKARSGYYDLSDEVFLQEIADIAFSSTEPIDEIKEHNLRFCKVSAQNGSRIVFSDTSSEDMTIKRMTGSCLLIEFFALMLFFCISIFLSRWAVRPVENAWTQQRQFVADASHELKTPLAIIMANAELLQNEGYGEQDRSRFSKSILNMTYQMRTLVENMLEMARVDNDSVKMQMRTLDFSQLVSDAVLSFQLLYEENGKQLTSTIPEGICLRGSEQHLFQVLDVLLDNALKYSHPEATVTVTVKRQLWGCVLSVASPGEPITKEDLKNIFKRFYRTDKARAMDGSYGLGLSIAESVIAHHRGQIWAESRNGINVFYVQLPLN